MRLVKKVCVVCQEGAMCYFEGSKIRHDDERVVDSIEDHTWMGVDGISHVHLDLKHNGETIGSLINVPVEIIYK